jgi:hypothetical protein
MTYWKKEGCKHVIRYFRQNCHCRFIECSISFPVLLSGKKYILGLPTRLIIDWIENKLLRKSAYFCVLLQGFLHSTRFCDVKSLNKNLLDNENEFSSSSAEFVWNILQVSFIFSVLTYAGEREKNLSRIPVSLHCVNQVSYYIPFPVSDVELTTQEHANVFRYLKSFWKKKTHKELKKKKERKIDFVSINFDTLSWLLLRPPFTCH